MTRAAQEGEWAPGQATSTEEEEQQSDDGVVLAEYPSDYFSWSETELQTDATSDATPTIPSSTDEWEAVGQARWDDTIVDERESTDADVFEEGEERANDVEWLDQYLDRLWSEWAQAKQSEERGEGEYRIEFEEEEARDANNMAQVSTSDMQCQHAVSTSVGVHGAGPQVPCHAVSKSAGTHAACVLFSTVMTMHGACTLQPARRVLHGLATWGIVQHSSTAFAPIMAACSYVSVCLVLLHAELRCL